PGPFLSWFDGTMQENLSKIQANARDIPTSEIRRWLVESLRRKLVVTYKGLQIQAGFATYNRWQRTVYDEPRTPQKKVKFGLGWTYVPEVYTERVEKRIPLPNWNQFYIRYKLVRAGKPSQHGQPTGGQGRPEDARVQIRYTITNSTRKTVAFRLPS